MKNVVKVMLPLLFATASFAQGNTVWHRIVGVITAPGTSNTVAGITSGGPWTATGGTVTVNLREGTVAFVVDGLVLVGGNSSGTPGNVTSVKGTLVCNAGTDGQAIIDTAAVALSAPGNANFMGRFDGDVPANCTNPLFLIRVVPANIWIATAAVREP